MLCVIYRLEDFPVATPKKVYYLPFFSHKNICFSPIFSFSLCLLTSSYYMIRKNILSSMIFIFKISLGTKINQKHFKSEFSPKEKMHGRSYMISLYRNPVTTLAPMYRRPAFIKDSFSLPTKVLDTHQCVVPRPLLHNDHPG